MTEVMIGGGGGAAIWIDDLLLNGRSEPCDTFDSPVLAEKSVFRIQELEVWGLVRMSDHRLDH
jgi:hypothetical protein